MLERSSVRIIVLNSADELLLIQMRAGCAGQKTPFWLTPGGGIEPGETFHQALYRELHEETGIVQAQVTEIIDPAVWYEEFVYERKGAPILFKQTFYMIRVDAPAVEIMANPDEHEQQMICGFRWWNVESVQQAAVTELFFPRLLPTLLPSLLIERPKETLIIV